MRAQVIFALGLALPLAVAAHPTRTTGVLPLQKRFETTSSVEAMASDRAQRLIGHASLANMAIDFRLKDSALQHLGSASAEAAGFLGAKGTVTGELQGVNLGKVTYDVGSADRDLYVPVWQSEAVREEFVDHSQGLGKKVSIQSSSVIQTTVNLNMKTTLAGLARAKDLLAKNDYAGAQGTIQELMKQVLVSENQISDPVLAVWSNLALAQEFIDKREFKSARFTLKKARAALVDLERAKVLTKDEDEAQELGDEIEALTKTLDEKSPGLFLRAKLKTRDWISRVKKWI